MTPIGKSLVGRCFTTPPFTRPGGPASRPSGVWRVPVAALMRGRRVRGYAPPAVRVRVAIATVFTALVAAAPAHAWVPDDPGRSGTPGGWQNDQWNFLPGTGVNAPLAWD